MDDLLPKLTDVFRDAFDDDEIELSRQTSAKDIEGWDSLKHVTLMLQIEKAFGVRFASSDLAAMKNVGDLLDLLAAQRAR